MSMNLNPQYVDIGEFDCRAWVAGIRSCEIRLEFPFLCKIQH